MGEKGRKMRGKKVKKIERKKMRGKGGKVKKN